VIERFLETELDSHLGYPKYARKGNASGNMRNGHSQKTLKGEQGHLELDIPRDRQGTFEPQLVKMGQTRLEGFDDKILALYARGMTTRDIQAQLQEMYGVEVSATLISNVTEAVMDEVRQWQMRPLEPLYPIIYVDCLMVNVRENQRVLNKALYLVLAVNLDGQKELLGMWLAQTEGARVLVIGAHRIAEPRGERYLYCLCGWTYRLTRSD
jgi:putative transposase